MTYLDWLSLIAFPDGEERSLYSKVLSELLDTGFKWKLKMDENRAKDGMELRSTYEEETGLSCDMIGPCSVLEMMVALALRCENQIMYDPEEGDRTHLWFWIMFTNLGLDALPNEWFDEQEFHSIMWRFLDRRYDPDGYFGPFYIAGFDGDMREIELWYQLEFYLQSHFL